MILQKIRHTAGCESKALDATKNFRDVAEKLLEIYWKFRD
jgi:hypothetical protein